MSIIISRIEKTLFSTRTSEWNTKIALQCLKLTKPVCFTDFTCAPSKINTECGWNYMVLVSFRHSMELSLNGMRRRQREGRWRQDASGTFSHVARRPPWRSSIGSANYATTPGRRPLRLFALNWNCFRLFPLLADIADSANSLVNR